MTTYRRPGVYVEEQLRTRNPEPSPASTAAVFVSSHGQGPLEPHLVRSWSDFSRVYGGFPARTSLLPYAVFQYFNNGGREAYVVRVTGEGPALSEALLEDQASDDPGETLLIEANNPGEWGDNLYIGIENSTEDFFDLTVYLGGTGRLDVVEEYKGVTMNPESASYVETKVNSVLSGSVYITVHDTQTPNGGPGDWDVARPKETDQPVKLSGGDNGADPITSDFIEALELLDTLDRTYDLNFPGITEDAVLNAALEHVADKGHGFVIIDPPNDLSPSAVVDWATGINPSSYGAVYYPYIHVTDPGANSPGATRMIPPGGSVAGVFSRTDASRGVWKAPAGLESRLAGAVSTERRLSNDDLELLNESHVNAIRHAPGAGFVIWGARTQRKNRADMYVPIRRSLNWIRKTLQVSTEWAVFEPNDATLWAGLESSISRFLTGYWQQGGLRGEAADEAFYVKSDADINPISSIEVGVVNVEIGVALQYPAEFVVIKLSQWEGGSAATEVA